MSLKLYLLTQSQNNGYDTYDSCIVAAEDIEAARRTAPSDYLVFTEATQTFNSDSWANDLSAVNAQLIGIADNDIKKGVILASFNAG